MTAWQPETHRVREGVYAIHGTAVALSGRGLLILGPSGAGKSSTAAGLIALGAVLVSDDRVEIGPGPMLRRPVDGPELIELRGIGLVTCPTQDAPFSAALLLKPSFARLPEREMITLGQQTAPLLRHLAGPDLAAKVLLWLRAAP